MAEKLKKGWRAWRFDQMAVMVNDRIDNPSEAGVDRYVGLEHLDSDSLTIRRWGSPSDVEATKLRFRAGDIILGRRRVYQRKLGVPDFDGICSAHAMVLRARPEVVLPEFLPFFMQSDLFMERAKQISVGSLSPTINWKTLASEDFALPPLGEQGRIAEVLASIATLQESYASFGRASEVMRTAWLSEQMKRLTIEAPEVRLVDACSQVTDGTHFTPTYTADGVPFLRVTDIQDRDIDWASVRRIPASEHAELVKRCCPERGDVLLSKNGTIGITKVVDWPEPFSIFVSLCLLKPSPSLDAQYLAIALNSRRVTDQITVRIKQGTVKNLHLEEIRECRIPLPSVPEQRQVVSHYRMLGEVQNRQLARLRQVRSLMCMLLQEGTG
jgi:hypothetical protein